VKIVSGVKRVKR
jgi:hypothetical protein